MTHQVFLWFSMNLHSLIDTRQQFSSKLLNLDVYRYLLQECFLSILHCLASEYTFHNYTNENKYTLKQISWRFSYKQTVFWVLYIHIIICPRQHSFYASYCQNLTSTWISNVFLYSKHGFQNNYLKKKRQTNFSIIFYNWHCFHGPCTHKIINHRVTNRRNTVRNFSSNLSFFQI